MLKKPLGVALLCFLSAACGVQKEKEPNEDFGSATPVRAGAVEGRIQRPDDVDVYRLDVDQESVLSVHVGGIRDVDFVLSVRDKDHQELKRADETTVGGDEELLDLGVKPGPYFIELSNKNPKANNPEQAYALEIKLEKPVGREREPDESPQTASPLDVPGVTRGHYWPARNLLSGDTDYEEVDWYRIQIASGLYLLNVDLSEVPKVDPILEVYDTNGYRLKEVDAGGVGEGESLKNFGVRGPAQYLLRLRSKYHTGNPDAAYEILTELIPYQGRTEFEPNDQRADATPFEGEAIEGTIGSPRDVDWFKLAVRGDGKQLLRANVSGVDGLDLALELRDALGNTLVTADNMGSGQPETLTGYGVSAGEYYLVVSEKTGRRANPNQLYTLSRTLTPWQAGLEWETNDSTATAQPVPIDSSVDGYIAPKGDVDFYQFNAYKKGSVLFELAGIPNVQFVATLYDQDGKEVQAWTSNKAGDSLSFNRELESGTYLLGLKAAGPEQNNVRDKYSLRLKAR